MILRRNLRGTRYAAPPFSWYFHQALIHVCLQEYREKLQEYVVDQVPLLNSAKASGKKILVEGANALMLDIDHG
jgi:adenylosuccinate synthase